MVSISNALTLALIGGGILAFYKLGGASGIGSRIGGGFSTLFDSFSSSLNLSSIFPKAEAATVDNNYQTWLDSYGMGDGVLDVVKKDDKYCVGGFCFDEDPNLAATPPSPIPTPLEDEATTVNTGGFIQSNYTPIQSTSWNTDSFSGVNITGSYTSQSIPSYSSTTSDHSQNSNAGGSAGNTTGGSSGGNSGGGGSSSGGSSSGGSSSGGGSSSSSGSSSGGGGNSGGSSGGSTGGSSGTSSKGGQGAGRSSNRGR